MLNLFFRFFGNSLSGRVIFSVFSFFISFQLSAAVDPREDLFVESSSSFYHREKKVGVGVGWSGSYGLVGAHMEFHFFDRASLSLGFGVGEGLDAFHMEIKKWTSPTWLTPYFTVGFARWEGKGSGSVDKLSPRFFFDQFLTDSEVNSGKFSKNMVFGGLGLQYQQLTGPWEGSAVYVEALLIGNWDNWTAAPTAELGYTYYF